MSQGFRQQSGQPPACFGLTSVTIYHVQDVPLLQFCPQSLLNVRILIKLLTDRLSPVLFGTN